MLRKATGAEETLFANFFNERNLNYEQLAVLGWQSREFLEKVAPIALLDFALSGEINGQRIIGWYNSPGGAPLAPGTSTTNAIEVMLAGYGVLALNTPAVLAARLVPLASGLGASLSRADALSVATALIANNNLPSALHGAVNEVIASNPQWVYSIAAGLLESVLSESTTSAFAPAPPINDAISILSDFLEPSFVFNSGAAFEASANNGTVGTETITLTGVEWRGKVGSKVGATFTNLPTGLTATIVITGPQTAEIKFAGKARLHDEASSREVSIKFTDSHFNGAKTTDINPLIAGEIKLPIQFTNNYPWTVINETLKVFGNQTSVYINLNTPLGQVGSFEIPKNNLSGITAIDARSVSGASVTLTGSDGNDTLYANALGSTLRGGKGDDNLYGGKGPDDVLHARTGVDTFVFESVAAQGSSAIQGNGLDMIHHFKVAAGGDKLDFTAFLGVPKFMSSPSVVLASSVTSLLWAGVGPAPSNGENIFVVLADGAALTNPAAIAALFGVGRAFAAPTMPAEMVLVTGEVFLPGTPGQVSVWFIGNRSAGGSSAVIEVEEVVKVAELVGVNSLMINQLVGDNFVLA